MKRLVKYSEKTIRAMIFLGALAMLFMVVLVVTNIVSRKLFHYAIPGAVEMTQQALVCIVWFGAGCCALEDSMLEVDIFHFPKIYIQIIRVITTVICAISCWASFVSGNKIRISGARTTQLEIPKFIFQWVVAFGFLMVTLACIILFIKGCMKEGDAGDEPGDAEGAAK